MNVSVWDTYVQRQDGKHMHFDILVPDTVIDPKQIFDFGKSYLVDKPVLQHTLTASECQFCHIETAPDHIITIIEQQGYAIIEMENCK